MLDKERGFLGKMKKGILLVMLAYIFLEFFTSPVIAKKGDFFNKNNIDGEILLEESIHKNFEKQGREESSNQEEVFIDSITDIQSNQKDELDVIFNLNSRPYKQRSYNKVAGSNIIKVSGFKKSIGLEENDKIKKIYLKADKDLELNYNPESDSLEIPINDREDELEIDIELEDKEEIILVFEYGESKKKKIELKKTNDKFIVEKEKIPEYDETAKEGYEFIGWYLSDDLSKSILEVEEDGNIHLEANTKGRTRLLAKYKEKKHSRVVVNPNGGSLNIHQGLGEEISYEQDDGKWIFTSLNRELKYDIPDSLISKNTNNEEGKNIFAGWKRMERMGNKELINEELINNLEIDFARDDGVEYIAEWRELSRDIEIDFDSNGGSPIVGLINQKEREKVAGYGENQVPKKKFYQFNGWKVRLNDGGLEDFDVEKDLIESEYLTMGENGKYKMILIAQWKENDVGENGFLVARPNIRYENTNGENQFIISLDLKNKNNHEASYHARAVLMDKKEVKSTVGKTTVSGKRDNIIKQNMVSKDILGGKSESVEIKLILDASMDPKDYRIRFFLWDSIKTQNPLLENAYDFNLAEIK